LVTAVLKPNQIAIQLKLKILQILFN